MLEAIADFLSLGWLYSALLWLALISTVLTIIVIISENRNPVKSLAWVTVLLLLPLVGLILYLFFGRNVKNKQMISRRNRRRLRRREKYIAADPHDYGLSDQSIQQINLGRSLTGAQFYPGNSISFFADGRAKFDSLKADLTRARQSVNIQYYIFSDDKIGSEIADILIRKAAEGVVVRVIYDHVGSFSTSNRFFKRLRKAGITAHPFFKVTFPWLGTRINWRNHRKLVIIDEKIAYIGGMNIADRYAENCIGNRTWRDTHLRLSGPAVAAIQFSFAVDWNFTCGELIEPSHPETQTGTFDKRPDQIEDVGAQILTAGPNGQWANISMAFHKAISNARRRVYIQTPYFLPTEALLKALQCAALAHVDVRLMLPERSDSAMLTYASASYIAECLKAGIKIYHYTPGMLHTKMLLVDDELVSIGSTNFDFRSFEFNFESNIFLFSRRANEAAAGLFASDSEKCSRVHAAEWRRRPFLHKAAESILRLLSPVL